MGILGLEFLDEGVFRTRGKNRKWSAHEQHGQHCCCCNECAGRVFWTVDFSGHLTNNLLRGLASGGHSLYAADATTTDYKGGHPMSFWNTLKDMADRVSGSDGESDDLAIEEVRLAAAALLVHATVVDGEVRRSETQVLRDVLERSYDLDHGQAGRLITQAIEQEKDAVDLYGFTSVLTRRLNREDRLKVVEMLWEIVVADGVIHELEANLVWRAAELLGVTSRDRIRLRKSVENRNY